MKTQKEMAQAAVSKEEWLKVRLQLLEREKELTRLKDRVNAERLKLPWVQVEKNYVFDSVSGKKTLSDLFDGRSQLIVQHFMLGPGWKEGCVGCSFGADHIEGALVHLQNHDVSLVAVSRAPLPEIESFRERMGWRFPWVSAFGSDFNFDYHVSFTPEQMKEGRGIYNFRETELSVDELSGHSVFFRDDTGRIFHTYSVYARGDEGLLTTYAYLDMAPMGRNETGPDNSLTDWVRHHDRYGKGGKVDPNTGRYQEEKCSCGEGRLR